MGKVTLKEILAQNGGEKIFEKLSFEEGLKLMEELVQGVESGTLPLDQAMLCYEKGVQMLHHLRAQLSGAEEKLRVLQRPNTSANQKNQKEKDRA